MGNKLGKRRYAVDERYTRPQGLYQHMDVDRKKLRKLILDSKLAPCYPGGEESTLDLEECPICFLHYPSLNRSRCCMKGICTECFLQMKPPPSACSASCPFCKTSNYAVEYRGMRTKEERGLEEMEEQKFIEAQIRMQQREHRDEEERLRKRRSLRSSNRTECEIPSSSTPEPSYAYAVQHGEEFLSCEIPRSSPVNWAPRSRANRYEDLDMDLQISFTAEDLWRDIQSHSNLPMIPACGGSGGDGGGIPLETLMPEFFYSHQEIPNPRPPPRPITARQQAAAGAHVAAPPHPPPYCLPEAERVAAEEYSHPEWMTQWAAMGVTAPPRAAETWGFSDGVCYSAGLVTAADGAGYRFPENVEEQMMLAMAVSPMEARGGAAWM